jgi:hypothetical protein
MTDTDEILIELVDEGVQVWAPVVAFRLPGGLHFLPEESPEDQTWAFPPGSVVRCELRDIGLVAVEVIPTTYKLRERP